MRLRGLRMLGFCLDNPATTPVCRPETVVFSPLMLLPGVLGVPTVADRVAQTVVARRLEAKVDPIFHPDSYGYRPGWSQLDAVAACRKRCWRTDWVIDLDIQKFFDSVPWDLIVTAVAANTDQPWVVLYVTRWLHAPLQRPDGTLRQRDCGTPQGALCAAAHNPPYEQCWIMRSVGLLGLVRAGSGIERCA